MTQYRDITNSLTKSFLFLLTFHAIWKLFIDLTKENALLRYPRLVFKRFNKTNVFNYFAFLFCLYIIFSVCILCILRRYSHKLHYYYILYNSGAIIIIDTCFKSVLKEEYHTILRKNDKNIFSNVYEGRSLSSRTFVEIFHNNKFIIKNEICTGRLGFGR